MRNILLCLAVIMLCTGQLCMPLNSFSDTSQEDDGSTAIAATLTHSGFDFSENNGTPPPGGGDVPNADGETIGWSPSPTVWTAGDGTSVWWRTRSNDDTTNYTKDFGEVSLDSVTTVPTTWDGTTTASLPPLMVNHVYVVKCLDGYAKFLVKAIRTDTGWEADVEFVFTSGMTF